MSLIRVLAYAALLLAAPLARSANAQEEPPVASHMLEVIGGLGFTFSNKSAPDNGRGNGGFAAAEYVFRPHRAVSPRLYAGALVTFADSNSCVTPSMCDVHANIFFAGGKLRLMAPIPWVGPFFELGFGLSVGYLRTLDGLTVNEESRGVAYHIPFAIGLAIGPDHQYDIAFSYLFHPDQKQYGGAFAFGLGFALP
jgi:hypothetical protein